MMIIIYIYYRVCDHRAVVKWDKFSWWLWCTSNTGTSIIGISPSSESYRMCQQKCYTCTYMYKWMTTCMQWTSPSYCMWEEGRLGIILEDYCTSAIFTEWRPPWCRLTFLYIFSLQGASIELSLSTLQSLPKVSPYLRTASWYFLYHQVMYRAYTCYHMPYTLTFIDLLTYLLRISHTPTRSLSG